ncbi:MAG: DUF3710 domain-containing protein [Streptomycetaceae bacterium]|nr:DUF3710 domain-containing protein [Streptomycetaceae bacterium]
MFRRRRRNEEADQPVDELEELDDLDEDAEDATDQDELEDDEALHRPLPPAPRPDGPWDVDELDEPEEGRIDLGGILVPAVEGMELRVEVAKDLIIAATVILGDSAVQLQAFAAPRSEGIWHEIRAEIAGGITQQGGVVDELDGGLGWELRAQVPVELPNGTQGAQLVRFVGCDGPRWFLRGVISGRAAADPDTGADLERIFRDTAVVRGADPMAPRDPILLRLPDNAQIDPASGVAPTTGEAPEEGGKNPYSGGLDPFSRGPEITEVR